MINDDGHKIRLAARSPENIRVDAALYTRDQPYDARLIIKLDASDWLGGLAASRN